MRQSGMGEEKGSEWLGALVIVVEFEAKVLGWAELKTQQTVGGKEGDRRKKRVRPKKTMDWVNDVQTPPRRCDTRLLPLPLRR